MVVINAATPSFQHEGIREQYSNMIGDSVKYCHMHLISLPQKVVAERPAACEEWLLRLYGAADRTGWERVVQHLAAVYAHCQPFMQSGGYISAMTGAGWYTWTIGMPPSWRDTKGKLSFSKLDASRTGEDQGNHCYYELHAAAMQLAFPGRQGLVPPIDSSSNTARSDGNVVETVIGICTALFNDYLIFSAAKKLEVFLSPDEYFTGIAEALCNFATHVYRLGCALEYSTSQPGEYAQSYCDAEGYCITPAT